MSRMLITMALTGALLVALHITGAIANVAMDPAPAISLTSWTPDEADPADDELIWTFGYEQTFEYTITDHDTFTPGAPPPPWPPYNGPGSHDDNVKEYLCTFTETWEGVFPRIVTFGDWAHETWTDVWVQNNNFTEENQQAAFNPTWDDQALGPQGVPPNQCTGSANDNPYTFGKNFELLPQ
jgi:hypothetical protein